MMQEVAQANSESSTENPAALAENPEFTAEVSAVKLFDPAMR